MGTERFAISYDSAWLLTLVGMGPRSSGVEVDSDEIRVRMGPAFGWTYRGIRSVPSAGTRLWAGRRRGACTGYQGGGW